MAAAGVMLSSTQKALTISAKLTSSGAAIASANDGTS